MAYNEETVSRIRDVFAAKGVEAEEKKMFSGVCFMVDGKMCCGTHIDKKSGDEFLLCRIGEPAYHSALEKNHVIPMEFTGRPMKGYVFVRSEGFKTGRQLQSWIQLCIQYNPLAKSSKKK